MTTNRRFEVSVCAAVVFRRSADVRDLRASGVARLRGKECTSQRSGSPTGKELAEPAEWLAYGVCDGY